MLAQLVAFWADFQPHAAAAWRDQRPRRRHLAQLEGPFAREHLTTLEEQSHAHAPPNLDDHAFIAEWALGQFGGKSGALPWAYLVAFFHAQPVEEVHAKILVALAFGVPQHRDLDRLHLAAGVSIPAVPAREHLTRRVGTPAAIEHDRNRAGRHVAYSAAG